MEGNFCLRECLYFLITKIRKQTYINRNSSNKIMNRDWIDSFPKNIPECIIHKILNLRPIHPVAELLKPEFDLLMRDIDTWDYPIVKEGDIFKRFMSHSRNCPRGFDCNCE